MDEVIRSTTLAPPPSAVWRELADFGAISSWADNADHSCLMSEQRAGVGMTRRIQIGRVTLVERVVAWEPEQRLAYSIEGLPPVVRSVINEWTLKPHGDGTEVTLTTTIDTGPRPPQQVIAKAVGRKLAAASETMLEGLAAHV